MSKSILFALVALLVCPICSSAAEDWPQFRGPTGEGHAGAPGVPLSFGETENVRWKVPVEGRGWSSPVILGDQIWLTTAVEKNLSQEEMKRRLTGVRNASMKFLVESVVLKALCFSKKDGRLLREVTLFESDQPQAIHPLNSYASPTPVIEPGRVYCHFGTFGTACIDTDTGSAIWKRQLELKHSVGPGSSPVLYDDLLILTCDGTEQQYVAALDKQTGESVWKMPRPPIDATDGDYKKAFSTPLVTKVNGRNQMIVPGAQWVVSYEPTTGKEIWRTNYGDGFSNVPRPVAAAGHVYICTGFMTPELWAIRPEGKEDVTDSHVTWKSRRQVPHQASPVIVNEEIFTISDKGVANCLDLASGKNHWTKRMPGNYSASPLFADERIYFFSREGKVTVIAPGKKYEELAVSELDGRLMASPAVSGDAMYLRTDSHLYRIETMEPRQAKRP